MTTPSIPASPRYSVSQLSLPDTTWREDVDLLKQTGAEGLGIWERKLPVGDDDDLREAMDDAGIVASICLPAVWSFLASHISPEPSEPEARLEMIVRSVERLAGFAPAAVYVTPGTAGPLGQDAAMDIVTRGLAVVADAGREYGVTIGFEPIRASSGGVVSGVADSLALMTATDPELRFVFDIWHLWDLPDLSEQIAACAPVTVGIQVDDKRDPTRSWADRTFPGEGVSDVPGVIAEFLRHGYDGWYDLELLSDNGMWGNAYPDSLWLMPPEEMLTRAARSFDAAWRAARRTVDGERG